MLTKQSFTMVARKEALGNLCVYCGEGIGNERGASAFRIDEDTYRPNGV